MRDSALSRPGRRSRPRSTAPSRRPTGRQPEAEGEDPYLAGNTAAQVISGAQRQDIISTLKHYTAYNQDQGRIGFQTTAGRSPGVNVAVSERALQEIYGAPFRTAVQQGHADSVMCSYNQINGLPSCQNPGHPGRPQAR